MTEFLKYWDLFIKRTQSLVYFLKEKKLPSFRCTPEQSIQISTSKLRLTQDGSWAPQSAQKFFFVICIAFCSLNGLSLLSDLPIESNDPLGLKSEERRFSVIFFIVATHSFSSLSE